MNLDTFVNTEVPAVLGTFQQAEYEGAKADPKGFPLERSADDWWNELHAYLDYAEVIDELQAH